MFQKFRTLKRNNGHTDLISFENNNRSGNLDDIEHHLNGDFKMKTEYKGIYLKGNNNPSVTILIADC